MTQQQNKCNHTPEDRSFTSTWCTNEVALALEKGYRIFEIFEVWHFTETSDTLFRGYVRDFMRIKIESSEPPNEDINVFRKKVKDHLDIDLGEIKYNAGMRPIAKLCLNLLWEIRAAYQSNANGIRDGPGQFLQDPSKRYARGFQRPIFK